MSYYPKTPLLFNQVDWFSVEQSKKKNLTDEIDRLEGNRLLNTSVDDLCSYFQEKYFVSVPELNMDTLNVDQREVRLDVSRDQNRYISNRSRPFEVAGTAVDVVVNFTGDPEAFKIQPTSYRTTAPSARIDQGQLTTTFEGTSFSAEELKKSIDNEIESINWYLDNLRANARAFNEQIQSVARTHIEQRRTKLLSDQDLVAALGFPLKKREDAVTTFTAPQVRRRIKPKLPKADVNPFRPEPVLGVDDYDHILSVMSNMAVVMERSPSAFAIMDEEALRSHFLVLLNGQYEGQATGETFNYEGKTDILVRVDGKNIFVAECKYWGGPKKLTETIDQILGYATWRDTKLAIIVFNRNKNLSAVLETIPQTVSEHPCFKRELDKRNETTFRYVIAHRDDANREMTLSILVFDVPTSG